MGISRFSSIARPIDPDYPTNRAILILTLFVIFASAGFQVLSGIPPVQALIPGVRAGIYVFLAWALARELDPDNGLSAFVAAFLACVGLLYFPVPGMLPLALFLLLVRILNRSTGLPAKSFDSVVILLLSSWFLQENWIFGAMAAAAFFLDSRLSEPNRQNLLFAGIAALISAFALLQELKTGSLEGGVSEAALLQEQGLFLLILIPAIFFVPHILASHKIKSKGDLSGLPLDPKRVQVAQVTALLGALALAVLEGWPGIESLIPLWSAVAGISLYGILHSLLRIAGRSPG